MNALLKLIGVVICIVSCVASKKVERTRAGDTCRHAVANHSTGALFQKVMVIPSISSSMEFDTPAPTPNTPAPALDQDAAPIKFWPVGDGPGHACRCNNDPQDNSCQPSNPPHVSDLNECKNLCRSNKLCKGIEFSDSGRCEIWLVPIGASVPQDGYSCYSFGTPPIAMGAWEEHSFLLGGQQRKLLVYRCNDCGDKRPVVLACPGTGGSATSMKSQLNSQQVEAEADKHKLVVVILEGVENAFNVGLGSQEDAEGCRNPGIRDKEYVVHVFNMLDSIVNKKSVFCTGYSRGGRFCALLSSSSSSELVRAGIQIRGLAPVASLRYPDPPPVGTPVMAIHQIYDPTNKYCGGGPSYWQTGVPETMESWAKKNECTSLLSRSGECHDYTNLPCPLVEETSEFKKFQCTCRYETTLLRDKINPQAHSWTSYATREVFSFFAKLS